MSDRQASRQPINAPDGGVSRSDRCTSEAYKWAEDQRQEHRRKADHNKRESLSILASVLVLSSAVPLLIAFGTDEVSAKFIPATLSLVSGVGTAWLQLRRPQELWRVYRGTQRQIEFSMSNFQFSVEDYNIGEVAASQLLVKEVSRALCATHQTWEGLVPDVERMRRARVATTVSGESNANPDEDSV